MIQTLTEQYLEVTSNNDVYIRHRDQWKYLLESYMGGNEYKKGNHLTKYTNETNADYSARLQSTHLDNHCQSVISTYTSFLFRTQPTRDLANLATDAAVLEFLEDADMDGRSLDAFMKEASTWASVFGHCWILSTKPNTGSQTLGDELSQGVRPYVNLITPLTVTDWRFRRLPNGRYDLEYLKYIEEGNDTVSTIREWFPDRIETWIVDHRARSIMSQTTEPNGLGEIPAMILYNKKSPVRGIGVSDISDIADAMRTIYNLTSEMEQAIRINGHPALVKTPGTEASAGAGAIIQMEDNLDPALKPYMLSVSTDIGSIYTAISNTVDAIDKMANTGSIRSTESRRMSGVAQEQEFQLLNARLSEKADNLQLAEEQLWQWFAYYQGTTWAGKIEYPSSFSIRDTQSEIEQLNKAKTAATNPKVLQQIDKQILDWMGLDSDSILPDSEAMEHPVTTAVDRSAHIQQMIMEGYTDDEILQMHPEISQSDITTAKTQLLNLENSGSDSEQPRST